MSGAGGNTLGLGLPGVALDGVPQPPETPAGLHPGPHLQLISEARMRKLGQRNFEVPQHETSSLGVFGDSWYERRLHRVRAV